MWVCLSVWLSVRIGLDWTRLHLDFLRVFLRGVRGYALYRSVPLTDYCVILWTATPLKVLSSLRHCHLAGC